MEFGIISLGNHATTKIIPAIIDSGNKIGAIYSSNRAKGEQISEDLGAEFFDDIDKLLKYDLDAVYISSPNFLHYHYANKALKSGKDVLLEKPMTLKVEESIDLVNVSESEGRKLAIGFHLRFHPGIQKIKEILNSSDIGHIIAVYGKWTHLSSHSLPSDSWWGIPEQAGGGSIVGTGVHVLDSFVNILGKDILSVMGKNHPSCKVIEDTFSINVMFSNGIIANSLSSRKIPSTNNDLVIYGDNSVLKLTNAYDTKVKSILLKDEKEIGKYDSKYDMYLSEIKDFSGKSEYIANGRDGVISTKLHLLSQESSCKGKELKFQ
ncbi:MAG: Gfo/Idh/MocA family protein [Thermoplasmata archaeon]